MFFVQINSKWQTMKTLWIGLIALVIGISSCEKSKSSNEAIPDGTYFGTFQRTAPGMNGEIANVSITLHSGTWLGESDMANYPALCRGTYEIEGNKIKLKNECAWTAQFDWSLILAGEYDFVFKEDNLTFSKVSANTSTVSFIDTFKMSLPKTGLKKSPIEGIWVETTLKTDTLEFSSEYDGQFPIFNLKREFEIIDGQSLLGHFSGPYNYKLLENSISTQWFLSSNSAYFRYYFNMEPGETEFKIGNFFADSPENEDTLTFVKIK